MAQQSDDLRFRTKQFALRIINLTSALPTNTSSQVIARQIMRSGTSIGANYREAYRARSTAEFIAKLGDCLKEAEETAYWLELLVESGIMPSHKLQDLQAEIDQLIAIFVTSLKRSKGLREENEPYVHDSDEAG